MGNWLEPSEDMFKGTENLFKGSLFGKTEQPAKAQAKDIEEDKAQEDIAFGD